MHLSHLSKPECGHVNYTVSQKCNQLVHRHVHKRRHASQALLHLTWT